MDNVKNDAYYIQKMRKDLEFIVTHMRKNYQMNISRNIITYLGAH